MKKCLTLSQIVLVLFLVMAVAGTSFAGKIHQQIANESAIQEIVKRGTMRVGFSTFIPWAMKDKKGEFIGFEIDVAKRVAEDMGVKLELINTKWSGIIPALLTNKFDIIIGGMGIRAQRNLKVNFSNPYYTTGMNMVAHKELAAGFNSLEDFNRPEVKVAARTGSTAVTAAQKFMPKAHILMFDDQAQAYQELVNGKCHAVIGSTPRPQFQALEYPDTLFLPLKSDFTNEPIGFALRKGDVDTLNWFNNWIVIAKADGWLEEKRHYWFETKAWESLTK
jgi:polar amino acid transport system substrate-binding protein